MSPVAPGNSVGEVRPVKVEQIEGSSDGSDSPLQGSGYGLYAIFGRPASKPLQVRQQEYYQSLSPKADMTAKSVLMAKWKQDNNPRKGHHGQRGS